MNERDKTHASFQNVVMPPMTATEQRGTAEPTLAEIKDQLDRIEQALKALLARS